MAKKPTKPKAEPAPLREPRVWEAAAMKHAKERYFTRRHRLEMSVTQKDGTPNIGAMHSDVDGFTLHALNAFGTTSQGFFKTELTRLCNAVCPAELNEAQIDAALAVVDGIQPENEVEAMLACQMAATHALTMDMMARALRSQLVPQVEMSANLGVKLMRTFTAQVEALAKLRKPPEQRVVVEHVHVHPGAQAVVGNVTHTGGGVALENGRQAHAPDAGALAFAPGPPVWSKNPERDAVPVAGSVGQDPLPDARRRRGLRSATGASERELSTRRADAGDGSHTAGNPDAARRSGAGEPLGHDGGANDAAA